MMCMCIATILGQRLTLGPGEYSDTKALGEHTMDTFIHGDRRSCAQVLAPLSPFTEAHYPLSSPQSCDFVSFRCFLTPFSILQTVDIATQRKIAVNSIKNTLKCFLAAVGEYTSEK